MLVGPYFLPPPLSLRDRGACLSDSSLSSPGFQTPSLLPIFLPRFSSPLSLSPSLSPTWPLPSLDDIFSAQLPLVSGFQDTITAAWQPRSNLVLIQTSMLSFPSQVAPALSGRHLLSPAPSRLRFQHVITSALQAGSVAPASLEDIFSGQLPLVSGFQDVITSALQPPSTTPAANSTPLPAPTTLGSRYQPTVAGHFHVRVCPVCHPAVRSPIRLPNESGLDPRLGRPPQSSPQAAAAAEATGSAEISAENADTGSSGREEQLSQAVMSGTDSGTGASGSSSSSSSNSESAPAAASSGEFDLGSAASAAAGGLLEGAAGVVAGRIEQRRAELRRSLTDMGITLPWYDQKNGQGADGQSSISDAAAAAGDFLEGATSALVGRIEQRRAELRKSLVDLGINLPWYDQSSGQGADGQGTDRQASPTTDVTASQEPSSFSSSLDDLRKAAFRQTEGCWVARPAWQHSWQPTIGRGGEEECRSS
ncbi:unnamed protein product [Closterium sp. Naga37s-1]|nr:unnamed protein product [Closterium sp. Naga37s-1]